MNDKIGMVKGVGKKRDKLLPDCIFFSSCMNEADRDDFELRTCSKCDIYIEECMINNSNTN